MSEYLTPDEVEQTLKAMGESWFSKAEVATLRAYAKVVEALAKGDEWVGESSLVCGWCGAEARCVGSGYEAHWEADHQPDCIYLLARELRGHADS